MAKLNLALLAGGISSERDVSIESGRQVYAALDKDKYEITRYDPKTDLLQLVADAAKIDVALIILHGPYGEDGTVQGLLELLGIPYQGAGVMSSAVAMNKLASKQLYEHAGLPVPDYMVLTKKDAAAADTCVARCGLPLVVKPVSAGSSVGISIVKTKDQLADALELAWTHDDTVLVEAFIEGVELTVGVIGNDKPEALPVIEIIPDKTHAFFDYEAKYVAGVSQEICPARIDEALSTQAQAYAQMAHSTLFCIGYSRTDMILRGRDLFILETNTIPGMTPNSLLPKAAQTAGISFTKLLDRLITLGLEAHANKMVPK
jgi:D-alanine-D-alanine ligase